MSRSNQPRPPVRVVASAAARVFLMMCLVHVFAAAYATSAVMEWMAVLAIFIEIVAGVRDRALGHMDNKVLVEELRREVGEARIELEGLRGEQRLALAELRVEFEAVKGEQRVMNARHEAYTSVADELAGIRARFERGEGSE